MKPSLGAAVRHRPPARIDRAELLAIFAGLVLAAAILLGSWQLETYTRFGPGPGFFLRGLSLLLILLALLHLVLVVRAGRPRHGGAATIDDGSPGPPAAAGVARFAGLALVLLLYARFLTDAGFILATSLLASATLALLGRPPWRALVEGGLATLLTYYVFETLLEVPLPAGRLAISGWLHAG